MKFGILTKIIEISNITAGLKPCILNIMFKVHTSVLNPNTTGVISMTKAHKETKAA